MQKTLFAGAALIAAMNSVDAVKIQVEANLPQDNDMYAQLNADKMSDECDSARVASMNGGPKLTDKCKREVAEDEARKAADPLKDSTRAEKALARWPVSSVAVMRNYLDEDSEMTSCTNGTFTDATVTAADEYMQLSIMAALPDCKPASLGELYVARCPHYAKHGFEKQPAGKIKDHAPERKSMEACTQSAKEQIKPLVAKFKKEDAALRENRIEAFHEEKNANSEKYGEGRNPL
jgi:hypothetical protein